MSPFYSIIIPVYNAEKFLEKCINSILAQTSDAAFEVILVNDGSRDGSAAICDRYAARDSRFRAIHQQNQGVSVARNTGLSAAKGQYILFLDSDDLWDAKLLESVDGFAAGQPDVIEFGCVHFSDSGVKATYIPACVAVGEPGQIHFEHYDQKGVMPVVTCWAAAYRRQFLLENELRFPVGISYGEDFYFCIHCMKKAQSVYTIPEPLYRYWVNEQSVTHTPNVKKIRDLLSVSAQMYRLFPSTLLADYYCMRIWTIENLKREDAAQLKELLQENRDILSHVSGWQPQLARMLFSIFGWYTGAKMLRLLANVRHVRKK